MHKTEEQLAKSTISTDNYPCNTHTEPGGINNPVFFGFTIIWSFNYNQISNCIIHVNSFQTRLRFGLWKFATHPQWSVATSITLSLSPGALFMCAYSCTSFTAHSAASLTTCMSWRKCLRWVYVSNWSHASVFYKVCLSHHSLQFEPMHTPLGQNWLFSFKESELHHPGYENTPCAILIFFQKSWKKITDVFIHRPTQIYLWINAF